MKTKCIKLIQSDGCFYCFVFSCSQCHEKEIYPTDPTVCIISRKVRNSEESPVVSNRRNFKEMTAVKYQPKDETEYSDENQCLTISYVQLLTDDVVQVETVHQTKCSEKCLESMRWNTIINQAIPKHIPLYTILLFMQILKNLKRQYIWQTTYLQEEKELFKIYSDFGSTISMTYLYEEDNLIKIEN